MCVASGGCEWVCGVCTCGWAFPASRPSHGDYLRTLIDVVENHKNESLKRLCGQLKVCAGCIHYSIDVVHGRRMQGTLREVLKVVVRRSKWLNHS